MGALVGHISLSPALCFIELQKIILPKVLFANSDVSVVCLVQMDWWSDGAGQAGDWSGGT